MDFLQKEIQTRKRQIEEARKHGKYLKRGKLMENPEPETIKEEAETLIIEEKPETRENIKVHIEESILRQRLRAKHQPVMLFGESLEQRVSRLEQAELQEQAAGLSYSEKLQLANKNMTEDLLKGEVGVEVDRETALMNQILAIDTSGISIDLFKHDPGHCRYLLIIYFKKLLYEWERILHKKSNEEKQQQTWIIESANQAQTQESMRPLFKLLKKGSLFITRKATR